MNYHTESGKKISTGNLIAKSAFKCIYPQFHLAGDYSISAKIVDIEKSRYSAESKSLYQKKIKYLCKNKPFDTERNFLQSKLAWPDELIFDENEEFAGYTVLVKSNVYPINKILNGSLVKNDLVNFSLKEKGGFSKRITLCLDLLKTIMALHDCGSYLYPLINPDNLLLNIDGSIFIIDIEEISIKTGDNCFSPNFYCPEYSAPEIFLSKSLDNYCVESNYYSIAIIIYQILAGIHPFQGISIDNNFDTDYFMKSGIFANTSKLHTIDKAYPHEIFNFMFSDTIQKLFFKTFEDGFSDLSKRPKYIEWIEALEDMRKIWDNQ